MRRAARIGLWSLGALAGLLLIVVCGVLIYGNSDAGRAAIPGITARLTGGTVKIKGLNGDFPRRLTLAHLEQVDDQGIWLSADDIRIDWNPWVYLTSGISVQDLHAAHLSMERTPHSKPGPPSTRDPSMPRIELDQVSVDVVELGAAVAGLPASLKLNGKALLRSVRDMQFDAQASRIGGDGEYIIYYAFTRRQMEARLKLHEPAGGPLEHIIGLPGLGALDVDGSFTGPRTGEVLKLAVKAGGLAGEAHGTLNLEDLSADLSFAFEASRMQPRDDLGWSHAALRGRWQGSLRTLNADGHLEVQQLRVPGQVAAASVAADIKSEQGDVHLTGAVNGLRLPGPNAALLSDSPLTLDARMQLNQALRPLTLSATHRLFALRTQLDTQAGARGPFDLRLNDLLPLAALVGQHVEGSADMHGSIDATAETTQLKLAADVSLKPIADSWQQLLGERARLDLAGSIANQQISLDTLKIGGRALSASANGSYAKGSIKARWDLELSELTALSAALAGKLRAQGTLEGRQEALAVEAHADATLAVHGSAPGDVAADIKVRGLPGAPTGSLDLQGTLDEAPLHAQIELATSEHLLHTVIRRAEWKSAALKGEVATHLNSGLSAGEVQLGIAELGDLSKLSGMELAGHFNADVKLAAQDGRTHLALDADAADLKVAQLAGTVHLSGQGFADSFPFDAHIQLPDWRGAPLDVLSSAKIDASAKALEFSQLTAKYREQTIKLLEPARLNFATGLSVDTLRLGAQKAELKLQGAILPQAALTASLSRVGPDLINAFMPNLLAAGSIEAHADLHGALQTPTGRIELTAENLRFADDAAVGLPATRLQAKAELEGSTAQLEAHLTAGEETQLLVAGKAPLAADGQVDLKVSGKTSVRLLNPLLEARGQHAEGSIEIDASVTGSVSDPKIGGTARLSQASWRDYARGMSLTNIAAELEGRDGAVTIKTLTATAAPGTLKVSGSVGVLQPAIPVDLRITGENAQPIVSKLVTSNLNADLHVSGNLHERLDVQGKLHLNRTLIGIPNALPPNVAVLDVRRRGKKALPQAAAKPLLIALDIQVDAPQQILVQGRGLDAEMGGALHIGGTGDAPAVSGGFDLLRGNFSLASTRLNFKSGRVGFDGSGLQQRIDPTLDFLAETQLSDGAVRLRISGYADAPLFEFSSDNNSAPDEIMAKLLFGQDPSKLSALQLAQVGAALASLSGVGGDSSPLVKLQRSLGLDRLSVGSAEGSRTGSTTDTNGASIEAGRYVSRRVYIEARQSTTGVSQLEADIDIVKGLKLQTRLGNGTASVQGTTPDNDPGSSVGLSYQFEY